MKKIVFLVLILVFYSCSNLVDPDTEPEAQDIDLLPGTWYGEFESVFYDGTGGCEGVDTIYDSSPRSWTFNADSTLSLWQERTLEMTNSLGEITSTEVDTLNYTGTWLICEGKESDYTSEELAMFDYQTLVLLDSECKKDQLKIVNTTATIDNTYDFEVNDSTLTLSSKTILGNFECSKITGEPYNPNDDTFTVNEYATIKMDRQ